MQPEALPVEVRVSEPPILVSLRPPTLPDEAFRWQAETSGLVTVLLELALTDLYGVGVVVGPASQAPGSRTRVGPVEPWSGQLTVVGGPDPIVVTLELCSPAGDCDSLTASAARETPQGAIGPLATWASSVLRRPAAPGATSQWDEPVSADPYATLLAGRSAAVWTGLLPPSSTPYDTQRDPISRAVYLDPTMVVARWIAGRRDAEAGRLQEALDAFGAARAGRPYAPAVHADLAWTLAQLERTTQAALTWDRLLEVVPHDPRFALQRACAVLAAGRVPDATIHVHALVARWPESAPVAQLLVAVSDARDEATDLELARWQALDPAAVEPVRRRVHARIRVDAWDEAWALLPELRARGADGEADDLAMALGVGLARYTEAAEAAERRGRPAWAGRIRARAALEAGVALPDVVRDDPAPEARLFVGRALLTDGQPKQAVEAARAAARARPGWPEPVRLEAQAYRQLDPAKAAVAEARLTALEPPSPL